MIRPPQSLHDNILWILSDHDGSMNRNELMRCTGLRLHEIVPILEDLESEDKIRIDGKMISIL